MGACMSARGPSKEALEIDANNDGLISKKELMAYIEKNAKLYAMLSVNCNIPMGKCRKIARDVAYQMAKQKRGQSLKDFTLQEKKREPTVEEFQSFLDRVKEPKGEQEFFHRTVFAAFDKNKNGYLEPKELDKFLDVFYEADSIFAGDARLPEKEVLKQKVMTTFDKNGDGKLEFMEVRDLISGGARMLSN